MSFSTPHRFLAKSVVLGASLLCCSSLVFADRETPQEKQARYESYVTTYQKLANNHLWLFRSTVNPAVLSSHIADGLDNLKSVGEYLGQTLDIEDVGLPSDGLSGLNTLESSYEDFKTVYNLLFSLQEQGFPGFQVGQQDAGTAAEKLSSAKENLDFIEQELPRLREKLKECKGF